MISDHKCLLIQVPMQIAMTPSIPRCGWIYAEARWQCLCEALKEVNWSFIFRAPLDEAVERFQYTILAKAREFIPTRWFDDGKGQHPWLNAVCRAAIAEKHAAEGTPQYATMRDLCSDTLNAEYQKYIQKTRYLLQTCIRGSRKWWKLSSALLNRCPKSSSIPALKADDEQWLIDPEDKANCFAIAWQMKNTLPPAVRDEPEWDAPEGTLLDNVCLRERWTLKFLRQVDINKTTGPDNLPARIIRANCIGYLHAVHCFVSPMSKRGTLAEDLALSQHMSSLKKIFASIR